MEPYLGAIILFSGDFAMKDFQICAGQLLSISQNSALFSLLGTYYGGNGTSNFQLPDLQGRAVVQQGRGTGLSNYVLGEFTGSENYSLNSTNIPFHNHFLSAQASGVNLVSSPVNAILAEGPKAGGFSSKAPNYYLQGGTSNIALNIQAISPNIGGGNIPYPVMQPSLAITYLIALAGVFPSRS